MKDRINTIIIYSDNQIAYSILLYLIEISTDLIKIGKQPWSYKNIVNITNWIVNKLLKNCIFTDNLLTNEIYKFGCMIGTGILPDIANVVFDYYSEFRQNNHYDLAANV